MLAPHCRVGQVALYAPRFTAVFVLLWSPTARCTGYVTPPETGGTVVPHEPVDLPGFGFPGATAEASHAAWLSGRQPRRLEAWPQVGFNTSSRRLQSCWKKTVLQDHATGWPGLCLKLFHAKKIQNMETCKSACYNEPRCAVWQFVNQTHPGSCWAGFGQDCAVRAGAPQTISVQGAQRIMHGDVRVLMNMSGWKIFNLYKIGMFHTGREELSVLRCKAWCYSDISCQYWQYGDGGCYVDSPLFTSGRGAYPERKVQYPLTTNGGATLKGAQAKSMKWGEYIQHYCPPPRQQEVQEVEKLIPAMARQPAPLGGTGHGEEDEEEAPEGHPLWIWCLAALAGGGCLAGLVYLVFSMGRSKKSGPKGAKASTRNVSARHDEGKPLVMSGKPQGFAARHEWGQPSAMTTSSEFQSFERAEQEQQYQQEQLYAYHQDQPYAHQQEQPYPYGIYPPQRETAIAAPTLPQGIDPRAGMDPSAPQMDVRMPQTQFMASRWNPPPPPPPGAYFPFPSQAQSRGMM